MLLIVNEDSVGQRLDNFLFKNIKNFPRSRVYKMIRNGEVRVNSCRSTPNYKLLMNEEIRIPPLRGLEINSYEKESSNSKLEKMVNSIEIIYEKFGIIAINKPDGISVHGGSGIGYGVIEAMKYLKKNPDLKLAHRLDKATSGVLLLTNRRSSLISIHSQLKEGSVKKTYLAICHSNKNTVKKIPLRIEKPLFRTFNEKGERFVKVDNAGQFALTKIKIIKSYNSVKYGVLNLIECQPITGRTHQIRVHLSSVGLPIVGDQKYGINSKFGELLSVKERMYLHSWKISIKNPELGEKLRLFAPIPKSFKELLPRMPDNFY